ncbi:MAG TPA: hypothetical protein VKB27_09885 [Gammaproteobacteria bacterium]|nr:hypothetical protein [Gammaproteobacteria bacterium]
MQLLPLPVDAAAFLQPGNLKGEVTDKDHHDRIEILAIWESISNSASSGSIGSGAGAGRGVAVRFGTGGLVPDVSASVQTLLPSWAPAVPVDTDVDRLSIADWYRGGDSNPQGVTTSGF